MEQQLPIALQVAAYAASGAIVVLATDVAGGLLRPFRAFNRTVSLLQTGVTSFLHAMWSGPARQPGDRGVAGEETRS